MARLRRISCSKGIARFARYAAGGKRGKEKVPSKDRATGSDKNVFLETATSSLFGEPQQAESVCGENEELDTLIMQDIPDLINHLVLKIEEGEAWAELWRQEPSIPEESIIQGRALMSDLRRSLAQNRRSLVLARKMLNESVAKADMGTRENHAILAAHVRKSIAHQEVALRLLAQLDNIVPKSVPAEEFVIHGDTRPVDKSRSVITESQTFREDARQLRDLEMQVEELQAMFQDMALLVATQRETLDTIELHIESSRKQVGAATRSLQAAENHKVASRWKKVLTTVALVTGVCAIIVGLVVVGVIVGLILII